MDIRNVVIHNIRKIRGDMRISSARLAERAKVSRSTIARIESGAKSPTLDMIGKIAKALRHWPGHLFNAPHCHTGDCRTTNSGPCDCYYENYVAEVLDVNGKQTSGVGEGEAQKVLGKEQAEDLRKKETE